ncbi:MAG: glycosyltransferase family 9 protein [Gemmatimonadaceae bacterium]
MAQTWPVTRKRIAALKILDVIGRAVAAPFRRANRRADWTSPNRILVIEPWNVGDVVLSTVILAELRSRYPRAKISLLAKPYAEDLLKESPLVDEIIPFDLPWTAQRNKYPLSARVLRNMTSLVRTLRAARFDLTIDARMDIRSNLLAAMTGARRRVGYDIGGGGWLLTDALPRNRSDSHKVDDWLALTDLLPGKPARSTERRRPRLVVSAEERGRALHTLKSLGASERPVIGYHPGGSHPGKRWPQDRFRQLIADLKKRVGGSHVVFLGPNELDTASWPSDATAIRPSLRDLMALLTCCDILVCNDSGPMHVADALDVPIVAIFEVGNPQWFGPSGARATVIAGERAGIGLSAAPLESAPANPVSVTCVADAVRRTLRTQA